MQPRVCACVRACARARMCTHPGVGPVNELSGGVGAAVAPSLGPYSSTTPRVFLSHHTCGGADAHAALTRTSGQRPRPRPGFCPPLSANKPGVFRCTGTCGKKKKNNQNIRQKKQTKKNIFHNGRLKKYNNHCKPSVNTILIFFLSLLISCCFSFVGTRLDVRVFACFFSRALNSPFFDQPARA